MTVMVSTRGKAQPELSSISRDRLTARHFDTRGNSGARRSMRVLDRGVLTCSLLGLAASLSRGIEPSLASFTQRWMITNVEEFQVADSISFERLATAVFTKRNVTTVATAAADAVVVAPVQALSFWATSIRGMHSYLGPEKLPACVLEIADASALNNELHGQRRTSNRTTFIYASMMHNYDASS